MRRFLILAALLFAIPATAQTTGVPTCYESACTPTKMQRDRTRDTTNANTVAPAGFKTAMTVRIQTFELEPIDVQIPKAPYGTTGSGTCLLRFDLDAAGAPENLHISKCPTAYAALLQTRSRDWRYKPLTDATGNPVPVKRAKLMLPWQSWQATIPD